MKESEAKINRVIGRRLRRARILRSLSLMKLGKKAGVSFQAIQKYETGETAITAVKLMEFARILGVPVGYFFGRHRNSAVNPEPSPKVLRLVEKLQRIERNTPEVFPALCESITALAKAEEWSNPAG